MFLNTTHPGEASTRRGAGFQSKPGDAMDALKATGRILTLI
jgi:hypothetical protein